MLTDQNIEVAASKTDDLIIPEGFLVTDVHLLVLVFLTEQIIPAYQD